jgi:IclR family KDG regulon transcriptional repressor
LSSLESIDWVTKDPASRKYRIGIKLVSFALLLASRFIVTKISLPYLYELSDITNETTALCIRIGYERMFVQEIPAKHVNHQSVILGERLPLWLGATGKAMVAYLNDTEINELIDIMRREHLTFNRGLTFNSDRYRKDLIEIKERGYAISSGEFRPDVCVLAAPIFLQRKAVIGALIVRGKQPSFNMEKAEKYSSVIRELTNKMNRDLQDLP